MVSIYPPYFLTLVIKLGGVCFVTITGVRISTKIKEDKLRIKQIKYSLFIQINILFKYFNSKFCIMGTKFRVELR